MREIIIWSKTNCPQCVSVKQLLTNLNLSYEERQIGEGWTKEDLLAVVPNAKSVPQVFIDGVHIGGLREVMVYLK